MEKCPMAPFTLCVIKMYFPSAVVTGVPTAAPSTNPVVKRFFPVATSKAMTWLYFVIKEERQ